MKYPHVEKLLRDEDRRRRIEKLVRAGPLSNHTLLGTFQAGALAQVTHVTIVDWSRKGWIKACKTAGGNIRVRADDLRDLMIDRGMHIPDELKALSRPRVLIVDDDRMELRALERLARPLAAQMELQTVDNGIEALMKIGSFKPHLVVVDLVMPGFDGIEVCQVIKSKPETRYTEVVIASNHLTPEAKEEGLAAGAAACFHKPFRFEWLLKILKERAEEQQELQAVT